MTFRIVLLAATLLVAAGCGRNSPQESEAQGTIDASFANAGVVVLPRGARQRGTVNDVVELPDGSLIIGGTNAYVAKLTPGGALDAGFAVGGVDDVRRGTDVTQDVHRLAVVPGGRVLVVEVHRTPCPRPVYCGTDHPSVFARRVDANGTPDTTYGTGGVGRLQSLAGSIAISERGRVTSFAIQRNPVGSRFFVGSLDEAGIPDAAFAAHAQAAVENCGASSSEFMSLQFVRALAMGERIVVATRWYPRRDMCLVRLNPDGSLDSTYAASGQLLIVEELDQPHPYGFEMFLDHDRAGLLLSDGFNSLAAQILFVSERGVVHEYRESAPVAPYPIAVAAQKNGKVVTVGFGSSHPDSRLGFTHPTAWRSTSDVFGYDVGFGSGGSGEVSLKAGNVSMSPQRLVVARDGKLLVGGQSPSGDGALLRIQ